MNYLVGGPNYFLIHFYWDVTWLGLFLWDMFSFIKEMMFPKVSLQKKQLEKNLEL